MPPRVFIIAGEKSADHHGGALVRALRELCPGVEVEGYGGPDIAAAGARVKQDLVENASIGLFEIIPRLHFFVKELFEALRWIRTFQPDVVIPIDSPGFNMFLSPRARRTGARVLYYVSPQVWAWGPRSRIKRYKRRFDKMLVLFPFEEDLYLDQGIRVEYVGHPLFDYIAEGSRELAFRESLGVGPDEPLVGLFPGSRDRPMTYLLPLVLDVAVRMKAARPEARFVLPCARPRYVDWAKREAAARGLDLIAIEGRAHEAMRAARVAVATSGTTTLECLYFELPVVVAYRVSFVNYLASKVILATRHISLPNIIAGREIVPEFLDWRDRRDEITGAALELYDEGPRRARCLDDLRAAKTRLGEAGASRRAALAALALIRERPRRRTGGAPGGAA